VKTVPPQSQRPKTEKEKRRGASDFHVMIAKGVGKVRSFNISPHILIASLLFFAVFIVASIFVINDYLHTLRTIQSQSEKLQRLQALNQKSRSALYRSRQRLAILEQHVRGAESAGKSAQNVAGPEENETPNAPPSPSAGPDANGEAEELSAPAVEIKDFTTRKEEEKLTVRFKIAKTEQNDSTLRGYVHIIATDEKSDPPQSWTYPKVALRDGFPINFKRGRLFVIKNYRTIKGEYFFDSKVDTSLSLRILAYDESGNLLLQKEFEVAGET
jgi:hypothetical protein